jgi:hypothetical protein
MTGALDQIAAMLLRRGKRRDGPIADSRSAANISSSANHRSRTTITVIR